MVYLEIWLPSANMGPKCKVIIFYCTNVTDLYLLSMYVLNRFIITFGQCRIKFDQGSEILALITIFIEFWVYSFLKATTLLNMETNFQKIVT